MIIQIKCVDKVIKFFPNEDYVFSSDRYKSFHKIKDDDLLKDKDMCSWLDIMNGKKVNIQGPNNGVIYIPELVSSFLVIPQECCKLRTLRYKVI